MLYYIFRFLDQFGISGSHMWSYISFRSILALILALLISAWFGERFIKYMKRRNIAETARDVSIDPFGVEKKGVPTMGGIIIIVATIVPCLLFGRLRNIYMLLMIATTLILGCLGFADDYIKTFRKNKDGLNGWIKIGGQVVVGLLVGLTLRYAPQAVMNETVVTRIENNTTVVYKSPEVKSTRTTIPFVKDHNANYADLFAFLGDANKYKAGWIFFVLLTVFVVAAVSNGANLNDGMDGMCAGNSAIIGVALLILAYVSGSYVWADYFDVMYIPGSEELVIFMATFIGALVGFLWWNGFPAQIFMGDTGSLTIGGIIGVCAVIIHKELLIPILCGVFLMESVSVILQTQVYRIGKKHGKHIRIWKRTPIHDHYRMSLDEVLKQDPTCRVRFKGGDLQHEQKIVLRFCIVTILLAAFTILTLKIR